jgi:hypothetical protein
LTPLSSYSGLFVHVTGFDWTSILSKYCYSCSVLDTICMNIFLLLLGLGLEIRASHLFQACKAGALSLEHIFSPGYSGYFRDGVPWTVCSDWPQTTIHLISASQEAKIIGVSHWCLPGSMEYLFLSLQCQFVTLRLKWISYKQYFLGSCFLNLFQHSVSFD